MHGSIHRVHSSVVALLIASDSTSLLWPTQSAQQAYDAVDVVDMVAASQFQANLPLTTT